jgi:hypothetical protein
MTIFNMLCSAKELVRIGVFHALSCLGGASVFERALASSA